MGIRRAIGARRDEVKLQRMGEWAVADVVQQYRRQSGFMRMVRKRRSLFRNDRERLLHECHRAERMLESRMLRSGKHQVAEPELANTSQSLKLRRFDQIEKHPFRHGYESV